MVWMKLLLEDLGFPILLPVRLWCDNQAAVHIAKNPVFHEWTKHIEIDCHFLRDKVKEKFISLEHVRSADQVADILTKPLNTHTASISTVQAMSCIISSIAWGGVLNEYCIKSVSLLYLLLCYSILYILHLLGSLLADCILVYLMCDKHLVCCNNLCLYTSESLRWKSSPFP